MISKEQKIEFLEKLIHKNQISLIQAQRNPNTPEEHIKNIEYKTDILCSILRDLERS